MNFTFTGSNIEVTEALKNFTQEKMQRLTKRHENIDSAHVTFTVEHATHTAEATIKLPDIDIHASAKANDMYIAIDMLVDKLIVQINKHKDKAMNHHG